MNPFYVCDRSNYVRFGNDKIHSCGRHDVLTAEGTCCPGTLKPCFYAEDIYKKIDEIKNLFTGLDKNFPNKSDQKIVKDLRIIINKSFEALKRKLTNSDISDIS